MTYKIKRIMAIYKIYCLKDPVTNQIRYIGQTKTNLTDRLWRHVNIIEKRITHRGSWINLLKSKGLKPIIELLELCESEDEMNKREVEIINEYRKNGYDLINSADGGKGGDTFSMKSEIEKAEINRKRSETMKGKNKGKKLTSEAKNKIRKALLGRKNPNHSKLMKDKNLGLKVEQIDLSGKLIKIWQSKRELDSAGFTRYLINKAIKNKTVYKESKWKEVL